MMSESFARAPCRAISGGVICYDMRFAMYESIMPNYDATEHFGYAKESQGKPSERQYS